MAMTEVLSDRVSRKKLILASSVAISASAWLMTVVPSVEVYIFTKAVQEYPRFSWEQTLAASTHRVAPRNSAECQRLQRLGQASAPKSICRRALPTSALPTSSASSSLKPLFSTAMQT